MSEAETLRFLTALLKTSIASGVLYGVYAVSYIASTCVLFFQRKSLRSSSLWFMLAVTALMFILSTVAFALSVCMTQQQLPQLLNLVESERSQVRALGVAVDIFAVITRLNPILSDIVCAWRAVILWHSHRRVIALLTATIIGTIGAAGYNLSLALVTTSGSSNVNLDPEQGKAILVFVVPMLGTNLISTGLIGWKAWEHRKKAQMVQTQPDKGNGAGRVERVLGLLIESGAVYCLFWVLYLLTEFEVLPGSRSLIVNMVMIYVSSIYPTLIIVIAGLRRSQCERYATVSRDTQFVRSTPQDERVVTIRQESIMLVSVSDFDVAERGAS
ncbi:hypothetical protein BC834DRAFT_57120 [Gloeopeniophorella convolvens]|nr:hypothetical protein BC834DRAFT_57120 [Gloeopeniophorella convolvens]